MNNLLDIPKEGQAMIAAMLDYYAILHHAGTVDLSTANRLYQKAKKAIDAYYQWAYREELTAMRNKSAETRDHNRERGSFPASFDEYMTTIGLDGWKKRATNSGEAFQLEHPTYGRTRTWNNGSWHWAVKNARTLVVAKQRDELARCEAQTRPAPAENTDLPGVSWRLTASGRRLT